MLRSEAEAAASDAVITAGKMVCGDDDDETLKVFQMNSSGSDKNDLDKHTNNYSVGPCRYSIYDYRLS